MKNTYNIQVHTTDKQVVKLGQVNAENGWHAMAIAKIIAAKKGLVIDGVSSDLAWRSSWGQQPNKA